jgi:hypothetical protein
MPDTYTKAMETIVGIREAAQANNMATRIHHVFAPVDSLPAALKIEPKLCHTILRTLHDLGDVLWYEDLGVELFENTVIDGSSSGCGARSVFGDAGMTITRERTRATQCGGLGRS